MCGSLLNDATCSWDNYQLLVPFFIPSQNASVLATTHNGLTIIRECSLPDRKTHAWVFQTSYQVWWGWVGFPNKHLSLPVANSQAFHADVQSETNEPDICIRKVVILEHHILTHVSQWQGLFNAGNKPTLKQHMCDVHALVMLHKVLWRKSGS